MVVKMNAAAKAKNAGAAKKQTKRVRSYSQNPNIQKMFETLPADEQESLMKMKEAQAPLILKQTRIDALKEERDHLAKNFAVAQKALELYGEVEEFSNEAESTVIKMKRIESQIEAIDEKISCLQAELDEALEDGEDGEDIFRHLHEDDGIESSRQLELESIKHFLNTEFGKCLMKSANLEAGEYSIPLMLGGILTISIKK